MRAYLRERPYVPGVQGGWVQTFVPMIGNSERWIFFPKDRRRRTSDDYSLKMAYDAAIEGRFSA